MVFKPFTHIARPSFTKALNHGYAQSVVAATQSSYISTNTPYSRSHKFGRPQAAQLHTAFQNASGHSGTATKTGYGSIEGSEHKDGDPNLVGYYEALWKRQQAGEEAKDWTQFQFARRIEWNPPSTLPGGKGKEQLHPASSESGSHARGSLERAYSTSAVDDIKRAEDEIAEAAALTTVDEAIAQEIIQKQDSFPARVDRQSQNVQQVFADVASSATPSLASPVKTESPLSNVTAATSVSDSDSQAFSDHICSLHEQEVYEQIPPVFESMVTQGLKPSIKDYNALLAAATHLPIAKHQVVPKSLNIYFDLLRRKVVPDTAFYTSLIEVLSYRAVDVVHMKNVLEKKRLRFGGAMGKDSFLFASHEAEYDILLQDNALHDAVKMFQASTLNSSRQYPAETYRVLITACALAGSINDMINCYTHMESHNVKPVTSMFPPMIEAFARVGDLGSVVDCYNEYKSLAVADDAGRLAVINRNDNDVYAAVIKAYAVCGRHEAGSRFLSRIIDSYAGVTEQREEKLQAVQDSVHLNALIQDRLSALDFSAALNIAEEHSLNPDTKSLAMARICVASADHGDLKRATKAFQYLSSNAIKTTSVAVSMLALHIRQGDLDSAGRMWKLVSNFDRSLVEPTTLYAIALIRNGLVDEGLTLARESFGRIRANIADETSKHEVSEEIDEAIEFIGRVLVENRTITSPSARMCMLWAMDDNGGPVRSVAEQMLAGFGPEDIVNLGWQNIILALQIEAELLGDGEVKLDIAHSARFAYLLDLTISSGSQLGDRTTRLIEKALGKLVHGRLDLVNKWHTYQASTTGKPSTHLTLASAAAPYTDTYDPYAATTDYRGSSIIAEELETRRNSTGLNEALARFRNIRRAGQHPRCITYAKLISAAAKEGRTNLVHDILGMARTDMPYLPQYSTVRHGWSIILDSMVGACLTIGRRPLAAQFHQEMLDMGTAPTANTFGLYITTLNDSARTFDEASEAVAIFGRAVSEGVVPSSFLYNALIGKLGKARRIDDCLRYFQEMRAAGIRPTSVTYGTVVNALCRVSDDRFAEELFDEMESMPNYKPRPAPYNSLMQFFLMTKRDSQRVLSYYERMRSKNIPPTMHTYKLLIDTYATLDPINLSAANAVLETIRASGQHPEAIHYASLIHAKGCVLHDMQGARQVFDDALASREVSPQACLYQALFESMVANHCVGQTEEVLDRMSANRVSMTPYIANSLIHGWAMENNIIKSKAIYESVGMEKREPSTYEAMTRAFLTVEDRDGALSTVHEMLSRGYPAAVSGKIMELVGHGMDKAGTGVLSDLMA